ncbi:Ser/Thr protein kinase RdoA (MazF antagonist) [Paenibacillus endophyticus]|uniref:Ser/Thr protein kinase RdoA (MazF antagonist) n=1 Tax=Paenibacillus endophyticus TaxID=1294268 RepID=A0A7W5C9F0_9BACL|nr:phosphotransferase [Paenibacillus endophyticus]MBB3153576.1 Ser/Thr protein kinase RdoA (MazF antagonist) [Paenibacillus endophyticus]
MLNITAVHTVFQKEELFQGIAARYDIGTPLRSRFILNGLNDTYEVETTVGTFILRIYKHAWRSEAEVRFELELLSFLASWDMPVARPLLRIDGELITKLNAPEGFRYAALFTFAEGIGKVDLESSSSYGRAVAHLHYAMDQYVPAYERFALDASHLLDEPLQQLLPFLRHRPSDVKLVQDIALRLRSTLETASLASYDWGICHGDLHGWNVFHRDDGSLTHFDFDCCGMGWRSYDLSVFLWDRVHGRQVGSFEDACWDAFLKAYLEERTMNEQDLAMIPAFVAVRQIWLMGLHTGRSPVWGAWQDDGYFDGKLKFLYAWVEKHQL